MRQVIGSVIAGVLCCAVLNPVAADDTKKAPGGQNNSSKAQNNPGGQNQAPQFNADRFVKDHDQNHDGKLSKNELPADVQPEFNQIDTNKDGVITPDELRQYAARMAQQRPQAVEVLYYAVDVPEQGPATVQELQQAYDLLRKIDKNGNGKLDPQEINAYRHERAEERVNAIFSTLDRNKDGKISKDEARGFWADDFAQLDKNGDGVLDRQEVEAACHLHHQAGKSGGAGQPGK